jgi:hypothetical protein
MLPLPLFTELPTRYLPGNALGPGPIGVDRLPLIRTGAPRLLED